MSAPHLRKVAGINSAVSHSPQTAGPLAGLPASAVPPTGAVLEEAARCPTSPASPDTATPRPVAALQDRLAGCVDDLAALHGLTERLAGTSSLGAALDEVLGAGAALLGARRGMVVLEPSGDAAPGDRFGAVRSTAVTQGLGLSHAELGHIETVPRALTAYGRILDGRDGSGAPPRSVAHPDILGADSLDPRQREVALRLGCAATYTVPLTGGAGTLGAAVWLYDTPTAPPERRRLLVERYTRYAAEHLARLLELERARSTVAAVTEELLPHRLPRVPGVRLAVRHRPGARGGGDWYDALPLPEGALGLAVGSVSGTGPSALAAMGRLRASLRAYAVMEGEDPVAVLSDLELLLRLTEPSRTATALFAYAEPVAGADPGPAGTTGGRGGPDQDGTGPDPVAARCGAHARIVLAGAGHTPPLVVGERRTEFVETSLSAPLGMLACWEAPSVELYPAPGETVLLYTDGLLRRTGDTMDRAFARLHAAAASAPRQARQDPGALADHVLTSLFPARAESADGAEGAGGAAEIADEDVVLLAARFA
ncbi:PP2C family protein-serine/threonine phosphatase [Streptomyces sp. NPDC057638]|uniref:PP2C family protein-serine/threonine phosphatase n=1 Tax=Streptomyces sp. NPDC057638 TaxID=3346190 RepID=UPI003699A93D